MSEMKWRNYILIRLILVLCALGSVSAITKEESHHGKYSAGSSGVDEHLFEHEGKEAKGPKDGQIRKGRADVFILDIDRYPKKRGDEGLPSQWMDKVAKENYPQGYQGSLGTRNNIAARGKFSPFSPSIKSSLTLFKVDGKRASLKRREIQEFLKNGIRIVRHFENKVREKREASTDVGEDDDRIYFPDTLAEARINVESLHEERAYESFIDGIDVRRGLVPGDYAKVESRQSCDTCSSESYTDSLGFPVGDD